MRRAVALALAVVCALAAGCSAPRPDHPVIGAKNFNEQVVLGELLAQEIQSRKDSRSIEWRAGSIWRGAISASRRW